MDKLLSDPDRMNTIIALITLVVGLVIGIITIQVANRRKELKYSIISLAPLVSLHEDIQSKVQVLFDGKMVRDVQMVLIEIYNSGNLPILANEYDTPLRIIVDKDAKILATSIIRTEPKGIKIPPPEFNDTRVKFTPFLLNGGDRIRVKMLVTQLNNPPHLTGRIVGVSEIKQVTLSELQLSLPQAVQILIFCLAFVLIVLIIGNLAEPNESPPENLGPVVTSQLWEGK